MRRMALSSSFFRILASMCRVLPRFVSRGTTTSSLRSPSPWPTYNEPGTLRVESGANSLSRDMFCADCVRRNPLDATLPAVPGPLEPLSCLPTCAVWARLSPVRSN
eukprot:CAMPEP_0182550846 /NCGR_PEP_ID=MMETSP1323-20130603/42800_1 /TAXON_ID=236787 /ORGANISM="Florenciella parvula, Strain RCC1693" /LENGTH=105 /DNA_ID=CAMNT_0024762411 /DNA_START=8 /DNA_END=322 /DNA_ORIENTATION=-